MHDVIEGMVIAFSLFMVFGIIISFVAVMWVIGRKERKVIEEYKANRGADHE